ncbi:hypothetical protein ACE3IK_21210 [Enterobacter hormaechei subsp. xiangfangensis]|uniref:hypothetical protein n=1 Tax=Enterobacter hormaechei TaxID=158836 RepID=UPI0007357426|nr:hypothetical protein [Enterobacter hormaechei]KTJ55084.1 hypothetical protein ASU82_19525 [Enterobacter hormaechei subsp. xiangfangensis]MCK1003520.1 hypothetical protein [Enterobacter hormaechei subsp. xiangfangensis]MCO1573277.1 hypothetical protein [Enterobacter hormaechei]MCU2367908.1 hypothetical protein [Enterobacter hormaechei subsp. xiangfangensis]MCU2435629.1 hypothetical protein [Enterobacter hormaechei subsp. xiangfangensis]
MDAAQSSLDEGKLIIAYSDKNGSTVGIEFSAVASSQATLLMGACSVAATGKEKRIVTSAAIDDTKIIQTTSDDGGDDMEKRIALLESDVSHIKGDIADIKTDNRKLSSDTSDIRKDVAVILQKLVDIDEKLSKKPSNSEMTTAITSAVNRQIVWTIVTALAVLGLARWIF